MISASNISKTFKLYQTPSDRLKEIFLRRCYHREFQALRDVSFEVQEGETLGIIGENGAGKSTILKVLTGILMPDTGSVDVTGKITGLLELGTGFNAEFSGIDNIFHNATYLGLSRREIEERLDKIIEFTELQDFIHEPIKTYSSGMVMRLAFSVAIHADPQAFVVDEALSVGDAYFQQKCMRKIKEFKNNGGSIIFVSHDMNAVKVLCDRAMLLDHGMVIEDGVPDQAINTYNFLLAKKGKGEEVRIIDQSDRINSYGNQKVEIIGIHLLNTKYHETELFMSGERCIINVSIKTTQPTDDITVGVLIRDRFGQDIFGTNTHHLRTPIQLDTGKSAKISYVIATRYSMR